MIVPARADCSIRAASGTVGPEASYSGCSRSSPTSSTTTSPEFNPTRICKSVPRLDSSFAEYSDTAARISIAARHASSAWRSLASGAPNIAMMPSPINRQTVPRLCSTASHMRCVARYSNSCASSASSFSVRLVEPTTSANNIVTGLRSPGVRAQAAVSSSSTEVASVSITVFASTPGAIAVGSAVRADAAFRIRKRCPAILTPISLSVSWSSSGNSSQSMALSSNTVEYLPSSRSSSQAETFFDIGGYRFSIETVYRALE